MKKYSHQEIQKQKPSVDEVKQTERNPIYIVLDNVRSLHNVGAIFRTADAVMAAKIFLCGITGQPPRKEITKTALGAEEIVPWEYHEDCATLLKKLKTEMDIFAVELSPESRRFDHAKYHAPVCFVFGHEVQGISDSALKEIEKGVFLPMEGRANSLNVATCCGIILYDALMKLKYAT